ncbi:catechol 2,3-dioxygenase-like lactoylglutathione lyase family enzyme [Planomicrobium stackebrandtii]|uniref:Catechol 2,3-dioxygenase-like lactoylglutathione lyase family enzyme n=1 Tax=Planomicrobium stackebrandtii TaxID=253160 RepID=A0ABU0GSX6_9BACL|nr:VOC family protein [Planomicrobium stackebrandtii]MDQ0428168.1 catechol 2,3-dioxygenase-like lactoylglutathione lyase family enzyme [Planomicrobium stackebrandtii]
MSFSVLHIDHVQVAAPAGKEAAAIKFYADILGMQEIEKPESLKGRGGAWFAFGGQQLHVGVEEPFSPAKKAHPAFRVAGYDELKDHLSKYGVEWQEDSSIPGIERFFVFDPFGNRLEFLK